MKLYLYNQNKKTEDVKYPPFILSLEFDIDLVINNTCIICVYNTTINHLRRCDNQLIVSNLSMICNCKIEFNKNSTIVEIFIIFFLYHCYCRIAIFRQSPTAVCFNYF